MASLVEEPFQIDSNAEVADTDQSMEDSQEEVLEVPKYDTDFSGFLTVPELDGDFVKPDESLKSFKMSCFNCEGEHNLNDCPEPKNFAKINSNRRTYNANRPQMNVRYHEKFENKYSNFSPGVMSSSLREALGLYDNQVSEIVYRMRLIGYPPGWLQEARENTGEMVLYGGDGEAVSQPNGEDGELSGGAKFKPEKLIEFPGFNSPLPKGIVEEHRMYDLPPREKQHDLERWREIMNRNKVTPYRKRKMKPDNTGNIDSTIELDNSTTDSDGKILKKQKTSLDDDSVDFEEGEVVESKSNTTVDLCFSIDTEGDEMESTQEKKPTEFKVPEDPGDPDLCSTPAANVEKKSRRSFSKGFVCGAVIPESITTFSELPESDKWTTNVTDHILFENLSDSVGTWDKMKGVMEKVKNTMKDLHDED